MINLDECESIRIHCIALYVHAKNVTYFDRFGVERISKIHWKKDIVTNIYRI